MLSYSYEDNKYILYLPINIKRILYRFKIIALQDEVMMSYKYCYSYDFVIDCITILTTAYDDVTSY